VAPRDRPGYLPYRPARGGVAGRAAYFPKPKMKKPQPQPSEALNQTLDLPGAMEELAAPAYVIDRDGRFRWLNTAYIELFGDRVGQPFVDAVAPEHRALARTNFARKVVGKTTRIFDLRVLDQHGNNITLRITSAPLRRDGKVVGIFGVGIPLERSDAASVPSSDDLTPRQQEVLRLLSEGLETQDIARRLGIADETARNHIRALLRATGAHSRLEAVVMGMRLGLIDPQLTQPGHEGSAALADD
jgi:PAS domain S-box-containing protein